MLIVALLCGAERLPVLDFEFMIKNLPLLLPKIAGAQNTLFY